MTTWFSAQPAEVFNSGSTSHWIILGILVFLIIFLYTYRKKLQDHPFRNKIRIAMAVLLLLAEVALQAWYIANGIWAADRSLPLHLCSAAVVLCPIMLITRKYRLYEVLFFWGIAGTTQAIVTPDLWYAFPHFIFFQYFFAHSLIVLACLWMTFVEQYHPSILSVGKTFIYTNLYLLFVLVVNLIIGSNYLYLMGPPEQPTILDLFSERWPIYILQLQALGLFAIFLCYLPFPLAKKIKDLRKYGV